MNSASPHPADPPENLVYALPSIVDRLHLTDLFGVTRPLEIELGSGDGSFLLSYAKQHPERNFIGVERLLGRIRKLDRKGRRLGLKNLRGVRIECAYFLEYLLPPHSVDALHIYFPDPWPKKKHRKYRLINERFPSLARQALRPGGWVHLRTDDADYFRQMLIVFGAANGFHHEKTPAELAAVHSDFEHDFVTEGTPTNRASYRLGTQDRNGSNGPGDR